MNIMNACIVITMLHPGFFEAQLDPGVGPMSLVYWRGAIGRDFMIGVHTRELEDGSGEITLPDGRKFKFGKDPVSINCRPVECEGKCEPVS